MDPPAGYGGDLTSPEARRPGTLRLVGGNVGGLPPQPSCQPGKACPAGCKDCLLIAKVCDLDAQIACWNEINLDWTHLDETDKPHARYPSWFSSCQIKYSHLSTPVRTRRKFGGTMTWSLNQTVHRLDTPNSGSDAMGRWNWTFYRGRDAKSLIVISAYRPIKNISSPGSVYNQQLAHLVANSNLTDPLVQFDSDLSELIQQTTSQGSSVVLFIDANTPLSDPANPFSAVLARQGLHNAILTRHPPLFPTRRLGSDTIDGIFVTPDLLGSPCGYSGWISDHCSLFIDLEITSVFAHALPPVVTLGARRLQLKDPRVVKKFVDSVTTSLTSSGLKERILVLYEHSAEIHTASRSDPTLQAPATFVADFNSLDAEFTAILLSAESTCRKFHTGNIPWSPKYALLSDQRFLLVGILRAKKASRTPSQSVSWNRLRRLAQALDLQEFFDLSISQLKRRIAGFELDLKHYKVNAIVERETYLATLAAATAEATGGLFTTIRKNLATIERQRRDARIIKAALQSTQRKGVSMVEITHDAGTIQLTERAAIEQAIITENLRKFSQTSDTPLQCQPLLQSIGPLGSSHESRRIFDGTFRLPPDASPGTKSFFVDLAHPSEEASADFSMPPSMASFRQSWKKQKERTSSYPYRHFGLFKAAMLNDDAAVIAFHLENIPLSTGIAPTSWTKSVDVMIPKQEGVHSVEKLRTIVLFDGPANHAFKWLGKEMMRVSEKFGLLAPEQHGSRHGRRANWVALEQRLTCDLSRQLLQPTAIIFNDAVGCYDRIVHSSAALSMQRSGVPTSATNCMFRCLQSMRHQVRTVFGDSANFYESSDMHDERAPTFAVPISGVGQGNGAGPQIWAVMSTPIANSLRDANLGFRFTSALSSTDLSYVGFIFVDDATIGCSSPSWTAEEVLIKAQQALLLWEDSLRTSGGAVSPEKTFWYMLDYSWSHDGDNWTYRTKANLPFDLRVPDKDSNDKVIDRLDPSEARRTLGVYLAPDNNEKLQLQILRQKSIDWATRLRTSGLRDQRAWQAFNTTISKSLGYSFPVTCLSEKQILYAWAPAITATLQRMGVGKDLPLAVRFGPLAYQGLNVQNPYHLQVLAHLHCVLSVPSNSTLSVSKLLGASIESFQLELGFNAPLFLPSYSIWSPGITKSWIKSTWEMCAQHSITVDTTIPSMPLRRHHDDFLMVLFSRMIFSPAELARLNWCRLYLQVLSLSDIVTADGTFLITPAKECSYDPDLARSEFSWPQRPRPSGQSRALWKKAVSQLCRTRGTQLIAPLGEWLPSSLIFHRYFYSPSEDRVLFKQDSNYLVYPRDSPGSSWYRQSEIVYQNCPDDVTCVTGRSVGDRFTISGKSHQLQYAHMHPNETGITETPSWATRWTEWPSDAGAHIAECLRNHTAKVVSDGSYDPLSGRCTASFVIKGSDPSLSIYGDLPSPGPFSIQDSYRGELAGLFGAGTCLSRLCKTFFINEGSVLIACDGLSALRTGVAECNDPFDPFSSHSDAVASVRQVFAGLPLGVQNVHVRGHQRERGGPLGATLIGPLDELATLNDEVDTRANLFRHSLPLDEYPTHEVFPSSAWTLSLAGDPIVHKLKSVLLTAMSGPALKEYWNKRHKFGNRTSEIIDWQATAKCMKTLPPRRQLHSTKLASTFVAVRRRQQLRNQASTDSCPRCRVESLPDQTESVQHLLSCPSTSSKALWANSLTSLEEWMIFNQTDPILRQMILHGLQSWLQLPSTPPTLDPPYVQIWDDQQEVGWQSLLEGRMVVGWASRQDDFFRSREYSHTRTGLRWLTSLLLQLMNIAWDQWEHRNGILHHATLGARHQELLQLVQQEFATGPGSYPALERLFAPSLTRISTRTATQLEQWITIVNAHRSQPPPNRTLLAQQALMRSQFIRT